MNACWLILTVQSIYNWALQRPRQDAHLLKPLTLSQALFYVLRTVLTGEEWLSIRVSGTTAQRAQLRGQVPRLDIHAGATMPQYLVVPQETGVCCSRL